MRIISDINSFARFCLVGVGNTVLSLATIFLLMYVGVNYKLANLIGYIVGLINSYIWNRRWVFNSKSREILKEALLFLSVFFVCYGLQYLFINILIASLSLNKYLAQFLGMAVYTTFNFALNKFITFKNHNTFEDQLL